eukprot:1794049-Amphidinium_carterae.2
MSHTHVLLFKWRQPQKLTWARQYMIQAVSEACSSAKLHYLCCCSSLGEEVERFRAKASPPCGEVPKPKQHS